MVIHSTPIPISSRLGSVNLVEDLAVISSVAQENPDAFKHGLLGWCQWSNTQPGLGAIALNPDWDVNRLIAELDDVRVRLLADMLKEIQTMPLKGYQLSFIPDVEPYYLENPEVIQTASGTATVTRTEMIGPSQIIWADYGNGLEHPHRPEDVNVVHPPEQKSCKRKRYPGKGKACGWIETRKANRKRQKPSEYWVYRWQDADGKHSRYLKKAKISTVRDMIAKGATVSQILATIHALHRQPNAPHERDVRKES